MLAPFRLKNPFEYPGRPPRFDPTHPASNGIAKKYGVSAVAQGPNFISLTDGSVGQRTNTFTASTSIIGPAAAVISNANVIFPNNNNVSTSIVTFGAIVISSVGGMGPILYTATTFGVGWGFKGINVTMINTSNGSENTINSGIPVTANVPYFCACSARGVNGSFVANFAQTNLLTGAIRTASVTGSSTFDSGASNGGYIVGRNNVINSNFNGKIAAVMFAPSFRMLSLAELFQWASDPWSFWYPSATDMIFSSLPSVTLPPYWTRTLEADLTVSM